MSTVKGGGNIVTDGLVLYLDTANQKSYVSGSTTWVDISRGGNNGKLTGSILPSYNTNTSPPSFYFPGNTYSQINCGNSSTLAPTNNLLSVFIWVNPQYTPSAQQTWAQFLVPSSSNQPTSTGWRIAFTTANLLRVQFMSGSTNSGIINLIAGNIPSGSWSYVGFTLSGSVAKSYFNTVNVATANSSPSIPIIINSGSLGIGYENNQIGNIFYTSGSIASFQLYNKALTPTEILQNFNATRARFGI